MFYLFLCVFLFLMFWEISPVFRFVVYCVIAIIIISILAKIWIAISKARKTKLKAKTFHEEAIRKKVEESRRLWDDWDTHCIQIIEESKRIEAAEEKRLAQQQQQQQRYSERLAFYEKMYHESRKAGDFEIAKCWRAMVDDLRNHPQDHV